MTNLAENVPVTATWQAQIEVYHDDGETIEPDTMHVSYFHSEQPAREWASMRLRQEEAMAGPWDPNSQPLTFRARIEPGEWETVECDQHGRWVSWEGDDDASDYAHVDDQGNVLWEAEETARGVRPDH